MNATEKLEKLEAPKPRAEARLAARNAALVEFTRVQPNNPPQEQPTPEQAARQGFWSRFRLSRNETRHGRSRMKWGLVSRTAFGAVASGCVAAFALAVMWPMFRSPDVRQATRPAGGEATVDLRRAQRQAENPQVVNLPAEAAPQPRMSGLVSEPDQPPEVDEPAPPPELRYSMPLPAQATSEASARDEEVVVSGLRANRQSSMETKRETIGVIDSVVGEDIAQLPAQSANGKL